jgi:hypothetical protein
VGITQPIKRTETGLSQVQIPPSRPKQPPAQFLRKHLQNTMGNEKRPISRSNNQSKSRKLRHLPKSCNLDNPEDVKAYLANKKGKNGYIESLVDSYNRYVIYNGLTWKKPRIKRASQPPYIPTTEEISILIADAGKKYALMRARQLLWCWVRRFLVN